MTTFKLSPTDFTRLQKVVARRLKRKVRLFSVLFLLRVLVWLCIGLAGSVYMRLLRENPELSRPLQLVGAAMVVTVLVMVAMPYISQALMRKHMLSPRGAFLSPQTVELTPSALIASSAIGRFELPWQGILAREDDEVNYYLFIDPMQAVVLPRSAVASVSADFEAHTLHLKNVA